MDCDSALDLYAACVRFHQDAPLCASLHEAVARFCDRALHRPLVHPNNVAPAGRGGAGLRQASTSLTMQPPTNMPTVRSSYL